jgi:hypothetical protein
MGPVQSTETTSTVPVSDSGSSDTFMASLIQNISKPLDPALIRAATSPIAGPHTVQVPSSLQRPVAPYQSQSLDTRPVVGRKAAKIQGISNAVTGATNALGAVVTKETQIKQDQIRDAATKVITAQQAIDEAQQAHDVAAAAGDTQKAAEMQKIIDQNTKARDGIFADPKIRKALVKGFDISYTDPQSNDTDEHKAVMAGIKQAKTLQEKRQLIQQYRQQQNQSAGQAAGVAYAQQQPTSLQPNIQAQQQLQIEQANRTASQTALKDYWTLKASMARANATIGAASLRVIGSSMLQQAQITARQDAADLAWDRTKQRIKMEHTDALDLIGAHYKEATNLVDYKDTNPIKLADDMRRQINAYDKTATEAELQLNTLQQERAKLYQDKAGKPINPSKVNLVALAQSNAQIQYMTQVKTNAIANKQNVLNNYNTLRKNAGLSEEGGPDASDSPNGDNGDDGDFSNPAIYNFNPIR